MSASILGFLLTEVINYGAPLFALTLFLGALGVPLPGSIMVIAVGAFSQEGYFSWPQMALVGLIAAVLGDVLSYGIGSIAKHPVQRRFGTSPVWTQAQGTFQRNAWLAIYLTRFLITALAIPTNLIAGGSDYKLRRFALYDVLGEATWIVLYGGLGYAFGSEWETVSDFISNFGGLILGIVLLGAGLWLALSMRKSPIAEPRALQAK